MYQALYRKWRPKTFDEVVGQEHITETLKNQIKSGRLSHAYLFIGTRGTGKTSCAKILAKAVNCENPVDGNPCGHCRACSGIDDGSVMDVVELDAASNNSVDNVRALRDEAVFSPSEVKKRVYIIDEVHMLSTSAFNALLKILEEPPEHLMFILATTELAKVPATILSRCQRHSFKRLDPDLIAKHLSYVASQEDFELEPDAAALIAQLAEGGMRDALSLVDRCSGSRRITVETVYAAMGLAGKLAVSELFEYIIAGDTPAALELFNKMWREGRDPAAMLGELASLSRDVLMTSVAPKGAGALLSGGFSPETLRSFAGRLTPAQLTAALEEIRERLASVRAAGDPKGAAELCLISLCEPQLLDGTKELRARVAKLEKAIYEGAVPSPARSPAPIIREEETEAVERESPIEDDVPPWYDSESEHTAPEPDIPPEDDINPEDFAEFQPEEVFLDRQPAADGGDEWQKIARAAEKLLPPGMRIYMSDPGEVTGQLEGDRLRVFVNPGFTYELFNNQNTLIALRQAAGDALGRPITVTLAETGGDSGAVRRDIEELKKFKEVHFTGGN